VVPILSGYLEGYKLNVGTYLVKAPDQRLIPTHTRTGTTAITNSSNPTVPSWSGSPSKALTGTAAHWASFLAVIDSFTISSERRPRGFDADAGTWRDILPLHDIPQVRAGDRVSLP